MACPGHAVLGRVIPKTLRTTNLQSITTKCKQRLSLGRSLGRPCPRRHALGMLSLAGSVPAPCERRTYTRKDNPNIFMQWGWELSQQWSSGEFRQIKVCNQKGQKGSTGRLGKFTTEKHWCPVSTFSYFHGKAFLGKPATITFGEKKNVSWIKFRLLYDNSFAPALGGACAMGTNTMALIQTCQIQAIMTVPHISTFHIKFIRAKTSVALWNSRQKNTDVRCLLFPIFIMDQIQTVVWQFFCASLGRSLCHGNEHHGIDPNMSNSGHHDSSTHLHPSYKIHSSKDFSCSMKFTTEKHWCPVSTFSYFHRKAFLGKPATITFGENKDVNSSIKFR